MAWIIRRETIADSCWRWGLLFHVLLWMSFELGTQPHVLIYREGKQEKCCQAETSLIKKGLWCKMTRTIQALSQEKAVMPLDFIDQSHLIQNSFVPWICICPLKTQGVDTLFLNINWDFGSALLLHNWFLIWLWLWSFTWIKTIMLWMLEVIRCNKLSKISLVRDRLAYCEPNFRGKCGTDWNSNFSSLNWRNITPSESILH